MRNKTLSLNKKNVALEALIPMADCNVAGLCMQRFTDAGEKTPRVKTHMTGSHIESDVADCDMQEVWQGYSRLSD